MQDLYNKHIYKVPDILVLDKVQRQSFMFWKLLDSEGFYNGQGEDQQDVLVSGGTISITTLGSCDVTGKRSIQFLLSSIKHFAQEADLFLDSQINKRLLLLSSSCLTATAIENL